MESILSELKLVNKVVKTHEAMGVNPRTERAETKLVNKNNNDKLVYSNH